MEKKLIYGNTVREQLMAGRLDKMHQFLLGEGQMRGVILHATKLVNEMRANHETGILETLILGYGYLGALLLSSNLKNTERTVLSITCDGPVTGISVEANAFGEVRGYLKVRHIPVTGPVDGLDLAPFFGNGILSVTRFPENQKQPFTGNVKLSGGSLAFNLARYSLESEQVPSSYSLSVHFDREGKVTGAGGLLVQAMPGADPELVEELAGEVAGLPKIGKEFADEVSATGYVLAHLAKYNPEFVADRRVDFMCHCNRDRFYKFLGAISPQELADIAAHGPFPVVLTCHNCNTNYSFTKEEVEKLI
ncbi:MAG: Hsp33 family molecular chaperone HslO [Spirochaetaceae bacterium]|nr:MAG: Hsp33 family molecular chaperone HslO [Spirochaetaceae bacterium]